jgi:hypothetical protein
MALDAVDILLLVSLLTSNFLFNTPANQKYPLFG